MTTLTTDELKQVIKDLKDPNLTEKRALYISTTNWWEQINVKVAALLQLQQERLCINDFSIFKEQVEKATNKPVWTLSFTSSNVPNLIDKVYENLTKEDIQDMCKIDKLTATK
jgi:hypothetical protein